MGTGFKALLKGVVNQTGQGEEQANQGWFKMRIVRACSQDNIPGAFRIVKKGCEVYWDSLNLS